jgi:L-asparaginase
MSRKKILFIDTGGTLNKVYNSITGELDVKVGAIDSILSYTRDNLNYRVISTLQKDSLYINDSDREKVFEIVNSSIERDIIIIHGTDTVNETADYLHKRLQNSNKKVILTGAMYPFSIDPIESSLNIGVAIGGVLADISDGVYISMSGILQDYRNIYKDREQGYFKVNI